MLWTVEQRKLWGDYGSILIAGSAHRETEDGPLLLHRAGPFLPPISFPWLRAGGWRIVVSDEFRGELERSSFIGLRFGPAVKARIIKLPWHKWDRDAGEPKRYPPNGEPAEYIWNKPHDVHTAEQMPTAWEFLPPLEPLRMVRLEDRRGGYLDEFEANPREEPYPSLFLSRHEYGNLVVDDLARGWFESRVGEWVRFCPVRLV